MSIHDAMKDACAAVGIQPPRKTMPGRWIASPVVGKSPANTSGRVLIHDDGQGGIASCWLPSGVGQKANARRAPTRTRVLTSPTCKEVEMAKNRICAVEDCCNPVVARGWCNAHYRRWAKHGDPQKSLKPGNGTLVAWITSEAVKHDGDECLEWPFGGSHGYGTVRWRGRKDYAHRVVCELKHGPQPEGDYHASHSCGNGHLGCVNPRHLSWKTRADNFSDRIAHGTDHRGERHPRAKLTEADVKSILASGRSAAELAEKHGVSAWAIHDIKRGKNWGWLS